MLEAMANTLPSIGVCVADNQRGTLETLSQKRHIHYMGEAHRLLPADYAAAMSDFISHPILPTISVGTKIDDMVATLCGDIHGNT